MNLYELRRINPNLFVGVVSISTINVKIDEAKNYDDYDEIGNDIDYFFSNLNNIQFNLFTEDCGSAIKEFYEKISNISNTTEKLSIQMCVVMNIGNIICKIMKEQQDYICNDDSIYKIMQQIEILELKKKSNEIYRKELDEQKKWINLREKTILSLMNSLQIQSSNDICLLQEEIIEINNKEDEFENDDKLILDEIDKYFSSLNANKKIKEYFENIMIKLFLFFYLNDNIMSSDDNISALYYNLALLFNNLFYKLTEGETFKTNFKQYEKEDFSYFIVNFLKKKKIQFNCEFIIDLFNQIIAKNVYFIF